MKNKLCLLLLACVTFSTIQAQQILKPTNPSETCAQAWQDYRKADILWKTGWGLFGAGTCLTAGGVLAWTLSNYSWMDAHGSTWTHPGFSIMCIGGGVFFASIPCLAVGQVHRKAAMKIYYENNCSPETCEQIKLNYRKADVLWKTGWGLFVPGLVVGTIGGCCIYFGSWGNYDGQHGGISPLSDSGCALLSVGGGMLIASIPCLAVGQRRKASQSMYQERCGDQPPLTFSLQTSANGLGLAMQF